MVEGVVFPDDGDLAGRIKERKDTKARHEVHRLDLDAGGEAQNLFGADHVRRLEPLVRKDPVHERATVIDDVDGRRQIGAHGRRHAERRLAEVSRHRHDAPLETVVPQRVGLQRLAQTHPPRLGTLGAHETVHLGGGAIQELTQEECAQESGGARQENVTRVIGELRRLRPRRDRRVEPDFIGQRRHIDREPIDVEQCLPRLLP